ncbi:hypothetical protein DSO57_1008312 [Entomophthora muscae]|uniref:Uncharacterized protein n=1 Tax=Entomophthora muscae TaxID=34485 RepID=A0ACC2RLY2_9FUNG|nr:hypothetical protein DSO57_1008312 [Entomophthora muscae]
MVAAPESLVTEVLSYVDYAALVYCEKITQDMVKGTQFHRRIRDLETLTTAHVFMNKKTKEIIVTFRGCDSYAKFKQGHDTTKHALYNIPGPKVHANVQRFTLSIYTRLLKAISNLRMYHPRYRVVLVGHSLGGAIATLMAPYVTSYLLINPRNIRIITYNQPRVGDRKFAEYYNSLNFNLTRVVNKDDPVPNYPPFEADWVHVHREMYIDENNIFFLCNTASFEDPSCSHNKYNTITLLYRHNYVATREISFQASHPNLKDIQC